MTPDQLAMLDSIGFVLFSWGAILLGLWGLFHTIRVIMGDDNGD